MSESEEQHPPRVNCVLVCGGVWHDMDFARLELLKLLAEDERVRTRVFEDYENIAAIEAVTGMPILRPLIGSDKADTIRLARKIGTYDISIRPFDDCCALFVPAHPETHARIADVEAIEADFDVASFVDAAVRGIEVTRVHEGGSPEFAD